VLNQNLERKKYPDQEDESDEQLVADAAEKFLF